MRLLALCDSPTCETGFSRVSRNLLTRWQASGAFESIFCWGIGYRGFPETGYDFPIAPAASYERPYWYHADNLRRFLLFAINQDRAFTHVWLMHDPFTLAGLAPELAKLSATCGRSVQTSLYFPIDALEIPPSWLGMIEAVDLPVAYSEHARRACVAARADHLVEAQGVAAAHARKAAGKLGDRIRVLPHGTDTTVFYPLAEERRQEIRARFFTDAASGTRFVSPGDILIAVVNGHWKRKNWWQTLETYALLRKVVDESTRRRLKLYLHAPIRNADPTEATDLVAMTRALHLPAEAVLFGGNEFFTNHHPTLSEQGLNELYNAADLVLNTTFGEGWGLTVSEAMAAGRPVAAPLHTGLTEFCDESTVIPLPLLPQRIVLPADNNLPRPLVDTEAAALLLAELLTTDEGDAQLAATAAAARTELERERYDWDWLAGQWLDWFREPAAHPLPVSRQISRAAARQAMKRGAN